MTRHTADEHALVRAETLPRIDPRDRPGQTYRCSCGAPLTGTSRRQARRTHRAHRARIRKAADE